jgi:hypothetical protein
LWISFDSIIENIKDIGISLSHSSLRSSYKLALNFFDCAKKKKKLINAMNCELYIDDFIQEGQPTFLANPINDTCKNPYCLYPGKLIARHPRKLLAVSMNNVNNNVDENVNVDACLAFQEDLIDHPFLRKDSNCTTCGIGIGRHKRRKG